MPRGERDRCDRPCGRFERDHQWERRRLLALRRDTALVARVPPARLADRMIPFQSLCGVNFFELDSVSSASVLSDTCLSAYGWLGTFDDRQPPETPPDPPSDRPPLRSATGSCVPTWSCRFELRTLALSADHGHGQPSTPRASTGALGLRPPSRPQATQVSWPRSGRTGRRQRGAARPSSGHPARWCRAPSE